MIVIEAHGALLDIRFPFDREMIAAVKRVPTTRWDPARKVWTASVAVAAALRVALRKWDADILWLGIDCPPFPSANRPGGQQHGGGDWAAALFAAVGPSRADAVFRALSKVLHPDVATGDGGLMRELLAARETRKAA